MTQINANNLPYRRSSSFPFYPKLINCKGFLIVTICIFIIHQINYSTLSKQDQVNIQIQKIRKEHPELKVHTKYENKLIAPQQNITYTLRSDISTTPKNPMINLPNLQIHFPRPKWPISILDSDTEFEEILHPGDSKTLLQVPKFWSPPLMNSTSEYFSSSPDDPPTNTLPSSPMNPEVKLHFGSYTNGHVNADYIEEIGNPNERTIFVSIASYRDWQCRYEILNFILS